MRDYAEIEAYIARARRMRSEAVGGYLAAGWRGLKHGVKALASLIFETRKPEAGRVKARTSDHLHGGLSY